MDSATQDLLYQKINESVYDEEKIVTCASIVHDLKISVKDAKTLLETFVKDSRNLQHKAFYLTYLLSGSLKDGKGLAVYLVKEDDLSEKKSLFEKVSSEVIFSIQKNKPIDFNIIALADKYSLKASDSLGFIVSKNCIKRNIKKKILPPPPKEVNHVKEKKSFFQKIASNGALPKAEVQSTSRELSQSTQSQEKQTKAKASGMMANFLKSAPKTNGNKLEDKSNKNDDIEVKREVEKEIVICNNSSINGKENSSSDEKMDVDEDVVPVKMNSRAKASSKKRKKENKNNTSNKKRKRIQEICDSDSDDIFGGEEKDEDIIEKTDEEAEPIAVAKPVLLPKNKRRKAVDKTYMDEEGFMVTTTEYIYESASEDEGKPLEKPVLQICPEKSKVLEKKNSTTDSENEVKNASKTKGRKNNKKAAATGKQTTLMNFFKKN